MNKIQPYSRGVHSPAVEILTKPNLCVILIRAMTGRLGNWEACHLPEAQERRERRESKKRDHQVLILYSVEMSPHTDEITFRKEKTT